MLFHLWELFSNTISEKADAHFNRPMQWRRHRVSVPFMRALFDHTKRQMHISINRCNDDHRVSACSIAWYIWEAMDRPPIRQHAFTMVGKSFGIPAILFYLASGANKNKWGDDNIKTRVASRIGIFRSVSVFSVITIPIRKGNSSVFLVSKIWWEPLKKLAGAPFFLRSGGLRPPFCALRPPFEEKKEFQRNFSKKEFPRNLLQYKNSDQKYRYRLYLIPGKYRYQKNDWNQLGMQL